MVAAGAAVVVVVVAAPLVVDVRMEVAPTVKVDVVLAVVATSVTLVTFRWQHRANEKGR